MGATRFPYYISIARSVRALCLAANFGISLSGFLFDYGKSVNRLTDRQVFDEFGTKKVGTARNSSALTMEEN